MPRRAWVPAAPIAILMGCAGPAPPEPVEPVFEHGAAGDGTGDLIATLGRAVEPSVTAISVTDEFLHFRSTVAMYGVPGIPLGDVPRDTRIRFANITSVEALEDANVVIEMIGGRTERIRFATREDARRFTRLLLAHRESP